MKKPRLFFWFIILLTIVAIFIDVPTFPISSKPVKLPWSKKATQLYFPGSQLKLSLGSFKIDKEFSFVRGLDLEGGTSITLKADMKGIPQAQQANAIESARAVIERRVNLTGVKEPVVQTEEVNGESRVRVELPGVSSDEAISLVGTTAQLTFWELATTSAQLSQNVPIQLYGNMVKQTTLTGKDLQDAASVFDNNTGAPQVQLTFTSDGAKKFADITSRNVGKQVAMVLDGAILEAPVVNQVIPNGSAVITGNFTSATANELAIQLRSGALPIPMSVLQVQTIGATLGQGSLERSLFAGLLGFLVIVIFMVSLYGGLGVVASFALLLYTLFTLAIFKLIPVTLTLAGIAGFILSIGMAVDANILIFERMKEEIRDGKSKEAALELGFSRAWTSIRDSNISTLITSAVLYKFGTGIVRGFALTLAIGVLVSMFSAIAVTRTFLRMFYRHK
ncbi:MAG TPA: protein translocase subunit SecD [Patescibacteria group bacterium]